MNEEEKRIVEEIKANNYGACNIGRTTCNSCPITKECEAFHQNGDKIKGGSDKSRSFKKNAIGCWENNCK